ncbi:MAG: hypothetical protein WC058_06860 [Phycisphaeraceae bacterium]
MKANRTLLMTVGAWVIGGTMLMGVGTANAASGRGGPVHGRVVQRHEDRGHDRDNDRHDDRHNDRDDRGRGGLHVGVTFGGPVVSYGVTQRWVEGYYVTQMRTVLVEPGHWEVVTVPAVTERRYPSDGCAYTVVVRPGYAERMWVADRYETRGVPVWVAGHYETVSVPVRTAGPGAVIRIGGIIRF